MNNSRSRRTDASGMLLRVVALVGCFTDRSLLLASSAASISNVTISPTNLSLGDDFTATWEYLSGSDAEEPATTGDLNSFDIDLEHCVNGAGSCQCSGGGEETSLLSLCPQATGCVDSDGSYDLSLPSSEVSDTAAVVAGSVYQVRVSLASDPTVASCTSGFQVLESADDEAGTGGGGSSTDSSVLGEASVTSSESSNGESNSRYRNQNTASIEVIAPAIELIPGQAFTANWVYDDGVEEVDGGDQFVIGHAGTFAVDLYSCAEGACSDGSCGTYVASLCEEDGCSDPGTGDYDVVIPAKVTPGAFSLYVEEMSEGGPFDCASFDVSTDTSAASIAPTPLPTTSAVTPAPTPAPSPGTTSAPIAATASPSQSPTSAPSAASRAVGGDSGSAAPESAWDIPETVPAKQVCDASAELSFAYDATAAEDEGGPVVTIAHASGNRTETGCLTMTKLWSWLQTGPDGVPDDLLYPVNPTTDVEITTAVTLEELTGVWLLRTSIMATNGVTLELKGTAADGDCDELKISSTVTQMHSVRAWGGNMDILKTKIQSWDETIGAPHDLTGNLLGDEPRAYIACVSEIVHEGETCKGAADEDMGECRMDMEDSELGYLGYFGTEAYGISWKVKGFCGDTSNPEVFDRVNVYGDMTNCDVHHMWYGMYSYGQLGGVWTNNLMHDNHVYGFDPHDDSDYLTIANNTVYDNVKHGIIASKRCDHVSITNNKVDNSGGSGIMLHFSCDDSEIIGNVVHTSTDAGVALVETKRVIVKDNIFADGKWGSRLTLGASDNMIVDNLFENNTQREIYTYLGSDEPNVYPYTGVCTNNTYDSNQINYVAERPVNLEDSDGTVISNNVFDGPEGFFEFDRAENTAVIGNTGDIALSEEHRITDSCFTAETPLAPTCT